MSQPQPDRDKSLDETLDQVVARLRTINELEGIPQETLRQTIAAVIDELRRVADEYRRDTRA